MKLSQFKFRLPDELIAQYPAPYREDARLLILNRRSGAIKHCFMKDIIGLFDEGDLFILNDTRVFPARLFGKKEKTLAPIEVFLLRELNHEKRFWDVLVDPARKIRIGNKIFFDEDPDIVAEVIDNNAARGRTFRFLTDYSNDEFVERLYALGHTPLPKYIRRPMESQVAEEFRKDFRLEDDENVDKAVEQMDKERYQTVCATEIGAVAAPASTMHFSKQLLKRMEIQGINIEYLTSHMSLGNFKHVEVEDLTKHKVESEQIIVRQSLVSAVDKAHSSKKRVCAVGTEVMRALEHVVGTDGKLKVYDGWTNKFIYPQYDFTVANAFLSNFYFPQSTQQMMVVAFGGFDNVMNAYEVAVNEGYKFGDYGDAMLIID